MRTVKPHVFRYKAGHFNHTIHRYLPYFTDQILQILLLPSAQPPIEMLSSTIKLAFELGRKYAAVAPDGTRYIGMMINNRNSATVSGFH
jgi:hypothetical protein